MRPVELEILLGGNLPQRLGDAERSMERLRRGANRVGKEIDGTERMAQRLGGAVSKIASAFAAKQLVSAIAKTRGEFQQLEVAFTTMLGSAERSDALMAQLTKTAATTPFGLEEVSKGAKQLLAYGFEADKVNETLIRLGDIAAGLSVPLNDLVYLYGTTMAQGRLYTQDLNQFTGRGIPLMAELAKQFGVAESKVKELVEAGEVGFPQVQKAIESLTDGGGKFGGLMEAQSKTITGQISNIEDAVSMMMNDLGQQSQGLISAALSGVSSMVENYERFGRILLGCAATYGVYRTALMATVAMKGWATAAEAMHYNWLLLVEKAQRALNATMLKNPYILVATLVAGACAALISMKTETERMREAEADYESQKRKTIEAEEEHRRKIEDLCSIAGDEAASTDTRREALNRLEQKYPDIFAKYDTEYEKLRNIKDINEEIAAIEAGRSMARPENELADVDRRIEELEAINSKRKAELKKMGAVNRMESYKEYGGLSKDQLAELKMLQGKRQSLSGQIRKDAVAAFFDDLSGMDDNALAAEIKRRSELKDRMKLKGASKGRITGAGEAMNGSFTADELQYQINKLQAEQNRRALKKDAPSAWAEGAKKKYEEALEAYNAFISDTSQSFSREEFEQRAEALKKAVSIAKKEADKYRPESDSDAEKDSRAAEKEQREAERRAEIRRKLAAELAAAEQENQQAETELMEEGMEKRLAAINDEHAKREAEIDKRKSDWEAENEKAGLGPGLSPEQAAAIESATSIAERKRREAIAEAYREEFALMDEGIRRYGTAQQQKLAIASEYAEKIRKAGSEAERQSLGKERDSLVTEIEARDAAAAVDWGAVFGEFGGMVRGVTDDAIEKARAYAKTDQFANSSAESQAALLEAVARLEASAGQAQPASFNRLGQEISAWEKGMRDLGVAQAEHARAYGDLKAAQEAYAKALASGTEAEQAAAKQALEAAEASEASAAENEASLKRSADAMERSAKDTASRLQTGMDGIVDGLQRLTSGSLSGVYQGLKGLGESAKSLGGSLGEAFGKMSDQLKNVPIVGWIASIIDLFKDGLSVVVGGIIDAVFNAISGIIGDVLSGDLFVTLFDSITSGIAKIFDAITFGGFSSWISSSNAREVRVTIDRLTDRNASLQTSIEDLTGEIKASRGTRSVAAYRDAYGYQQEAIANYLGIAQAQAGYHGAHHSWNYYWGGFSPEQIARLSGQIGREWDGSLWSLSPEEMKRLRGNVDMWEAIRETGKGGYGDELADRLADYIDQAGKLEEMTSELYEGLTGISFDSMYDSFVDRLMDMDATAEDFADGIGEYFMRAMLSNKIGELYADRLEAWWREFGQAMEDNDLTEAERHALSGEYMGFVEEAMRLRDSLAAATGYDKIHEAGGGQSGKAGGFSAMSQDQGTKLEGLFVSVQGHVASIDLLCEDISAKYSRAEALLARIADNTGDSAATLKEIKAFLDKLGRDGIRTR